MKQNKTSKRGLIQIYTGNGKGKTTAALGVALRAVGQGKKVCFIQWLKNGCSSGEKKISRKLADFSFFCFGRKAFLTPRNIQEQDRRLAISALDKLSQVFKQKKYDLVVLDEIFPAITLRLIKEKDLLQLLRQRPKSTELILTGRNAPNSIICLADLVSEIKEKKHYFKKGVRARKGFDY
jgi:cob(I)alamin adenosyltransferase